MLGHLGEMLSSEEFMPHGMCFLWRPDLLWLHAGSDALIALAYYSIPVALIYFVRRRKDLVFPALSSSCSASSSSPAAPRISWAFGRSGIRTIGSTVPSRPAPPAISDRQRYPSLACHARCRWRCPTVASSRPRTGSWPARSKIRSRNEERGCAASIRSSSSAWPSAQGRPREPPTSNCERHWPRRRCCCARSSTG